MNVYSEDSDSDFLRYPLKCDRSLQLPPAEKPIFPYDRFCEYVSTNFDNEQQNRHDALGQPVRSAEYYTDAVLKEEFLSIYGDFDQRSNKFQLIFDNYKEERLDQIATWIKEEEAIFGKESQASGSDNTFSVTDLQQKFTDAEINLFKGIALRNSATTIDPFLIPRKAINDKDIFQEYVLQPKTVQHLRDFDPDINLKNFVVPEIADTNVGGKLVERMVNIIKKHPTGISETAFRMEFKKQNKYCPESKDMDYSNNIQMMSDLGEHLIQIQQLPDHWEYFLYPMCLQGLLSSPKDMFWQLLHKIKIIVNLNRGIVKVSKAMKLCSQIFGWGKIDFQAWGFESENEFVEFLMKYYKELDMKLVPETKVKSQGRPHVSYLIMCASNKQDKFLDRQISKTDREQVQSKASIKLSDQRPMCQSHIPPQGQWQSKPFVGTNTQMPKPKYQHQTHPQTLPENNSRFRQRDNPPAIRGPSNATSLPRGPAPAKTWSKLLFK